MRSIRSLLLSTWDSNTKVAELQAITFDFWNTLIVQQTAAGRTLRKAMLLETLGELGYSVEPELVDAAFEVVAERFDAAWKAGNQFVLTDGVAAFREVVDADPQHDAQLAATWYRCGQDLPLQLVEPDLGDTLASLSDMGVAIGIICDVGLIPSPVLLGHLDRLGIGSMFDHWSFSDEVGYYKPASEIFAHSHAGLGVADPGAAVHIGDLRRTDVAGARSFGAVSARYRGVVDDVDNELPESDHVVTSHAELLELF